MLSYIGHWTVAVVYSYMFKFSIFLSLIFSLLPNIENISLKPLGIKLRRRYMHSLILQAVGFSIVILILKMLGLNYRLPIHVWALFLIHSFLDIFDSKGVMLLYPVRREYYSIYGMFHSEHVDKRYDGFKLSKLKKLSKLPVEEKFTFLLEVSIFLLALLYFITHGLLRESAILLIGPIIAFLHLLILKRRA